GALQPRQRLGGFPARGHRLVGVKGGLYLARGSFCAAHVLDPMLMMPSPAAYTPAASATSAALGPCSTASGALITCKAASRRPLASSPRCLRMASSFASISAERLRQSLRRMPPRQASVKLSRTSFSTVCSITGSSRYVNMPECGVVLVGKIAGVPVGSLALAACGLSSVSARKSKLIFSLAILSGVV